MVGNLYMHEAAVPDIFAAKNLLRFCLCEQRSMSMQRVAVFQGGMQTTGRVVPSLSLSLSFPAAEQTAAARSSLLGCLLPKKRCSYPE